MSRSRSIALCSSVHFVTFFASSSQFNYQLLTKCTCIFCRVSVYDYFILYLSVCFLVLTAFRSSPHALTSAVVGIYSWRIRRVWIFIAGVYTCKEITSLRICPESAEIWWQRKNMVLTVMRLSLARSNYLTRWPLAAEEFQIWISLGSDS